MPEVILTGLRAEPLAQYLAALGVLRLVAEQVDAEATGHWRDDTFVLTSELDEDQLVEFFVASYRPSPVLGPWNGGSGFYPKDNTDGLDAILGSDTDRFAEYRKVIGEVRVVLGNLGLEAKPDKKAKTELIVRLRSELSDSALDWVDAALVLTNDGEKFPPLLGTGGNDGRLEFSNNFMKRIADLLLGKVSADPRIVRGFLFGEPTQALQGAPVGQFYPSQAGGVNATAGFDAASQINPWSFVLMIEGALVPSSTATRRLESSRGGSLSFPFSVRSAMVGYASASPEETRDELWLPLWTAPATFREVRHLYAEGRAKVPTRRGGKADQREAVDGLDFARAIASLGVNRGIDSFARFGFQQRNGLSFFAVPLGRWIVRRSKGADLLAELDAWLTRLRSHVNSGKASASVASATRRLEGAIMEVCQREDWTTMLEVLIALGELESTISRAKERPLEPLPSLSPQWYSLTKGDPTPEYRLAASLASAGLRPRLIPVERKGKRHWSWLPASSKTATWMATASLETNLIELLRRREIEDQQGEKRRHQADAWAIGIADAREKAGRPRVWASLADIAAFIDGPRVSGIDENRLEALVWGLSLIDWARVSPQPSPQDRELPPAGYMLMALARERFLPGSAVELLPSTPGMLANAAAGRLDDATLLAIRRLHGIGLSFPVRRLGDDRARARRITAALAFPLSPESLAMLEQQLFPRHLGFEFDADTDPDPDTDPNREDVHP